MAHTQPQTALIKFHLNSRSKTQKSVAKKIGVKAPTLSQVINGRKTSKRVEKALARILGVSREALFPTVAA